MLSAERNILILDGGTAGWPIMLLESPDIGIIGVNEGTFPAIRETLRFLDIDERSSIRESSATPKQGILFNDWLHAPRSGNGHRASPRSATPMMAYSSPASSASDYIYCHIHAGDGAWLAR